MYTGPYCCSGGQNSAFIRCSGVISIKDKCYLSSAGGFEGEKLGQTTTGSTTAALLHAAGRRYLVRSDFFPSGGSFTLLSRAGELMGVGRRGKNSEEGLVRHRTPRARRAPVHHGEGPREVF